MICNKNRLNWQRYEEAKKKFLKREHLQSPYENLFRETLNAYDVLRFTKFDRLKNLTELFPGHLRHELNYINLTSVVELMSWRCYEIFSNCSWQNQSIDCCDLFSQRRSPKGLCLSFNTIESKEGARRHHTDPFYPWRSLSSGLRNGLRIRIHIQEGWHSPFSKNSKGILVRFF